MCKRVEEGVMIRFGPPFELDQSLLAMVDILYFCGVFSPNIGGKGIHVAMCALKRGGVSLPLGWV